jgi:hypothetical protein
MISYRLIAPAIGNLLGVGGTGYEGSILRAKEERWTETDVEALLGSVPGASLSLWKCDRILGPADGRLGIEAARLRMEKPSNRSPFAKFPELQQHAIHQESQFVSDGRYLAGYIKLDSFYARAAIADIVKLLTYGSGFHRTGLIAIHPSGSLAPMEPTNLEVMKSLNALMTFKLKKYISQAEWEQDLPAKETVLMDAAASLLSVSALPLIPLQIGDVEIAFLSLGRSSFADSSSNAALNQKPLEASDVSSWEVGLFI